MALYNNNLPSETQLELSTSVPSLGAKCTFEQNRTW